MGEFRTGFWTLVATFLTAAGMAGIAVSQVTPPDSKAPKQVDVKSVTPTTGLPTKSAKTATSVSVQAVQGAAVSCSAPVTAGGRGLTRAGSLQEAKNNWQIAADGAQWNSAINATDHCEREGPAHAVRQWLCVVTAEACLGGVGGSSGGTGTPACHPSFAVDGNDAKVQGLAETRAVDAWQSSANSAHGNNYKYWPKAQNKDISCRNNGLGPMQRRWICTARGQPCL